MQAKKSRFKNSVIVNQTENVTLTDTNQNQLQEENSANKYKCGVCGGSGHNARNKKKCPQQASL